MFTSSILESGPTFQDITATHLAIVANARRAVQVTAERLLAEVLAQLSADLVAWKPSERCLEVFPFFADTASVAKTYAASLSVLILDNGSVTLQRNDDMLKRAGLPAELGRILELGTDVSPSFPHLRYLTLQAVSERASRA